MYNSGLNLLFQVDLFNSTWSIFFKILPPPPHKKKKNKTKTKNINFFTGLFSLIWFFYNSHQNNSWSIAEEIFPINVLFALCASTSVLQTSIKFFFLGITCELNHCIYQISSTWNQTSTLGPCYDFHENIHLYFLYQFHQSKLELLTGSVAANMKLEVYDKNDKLVCNITDNEALLGSFPVDDGMRLHVKSF